MTAYRPWMPHRCVCRCHTNSNFKHIAACCCPHRIKNRRDCPDCKQFQAIPITPYFRVRLEEEAIRVFSAPVFLIYPLRDPDSYWLTKNQIEEQMERYNKESFPEEEITSNPMMIPIPKTRALYDAKERIRKIGRKQ